jgi:hypothetical protein
MGIRSGGSVSHVHVLGNALELGEGGLEFVHNLGRPRVRVESSPIVPAGIGDDGQPRMKNYMFVTALEYNGSRPLASRPLGG